MKAYIVTITGMCLISAICEMIMPSGTYKKYIKIVCGIVMLCVIANPIMTRNFKNSLFSADEFFVETNENKALDSAVKMFEKRLGSEIEKHLFDKFLLESKVLVKASDDSENLGQIEEVLITVYSADSIDKEAVLKSISESFGVFEAEFKEVAK